jgi:glycosyltransferase involved in cell wall biosynthesis
MQFVARQNCKDEIPSAPFAMNALGHSCVSIGMPVRNCERTLEMAIRSIVRQTYHNWELLIMDDGSTDKTVAIARRFGDTRIKVASDGVHRGLPTRLNEAISLSTGKYFARMDGDDVSYPERFARQIQYLEEHSEIDLLGAGILVFKGDGCVRGTRTIWQTHEEICGRPWAGFYLPHPTWMGKTNWFRKHCYQPEAVRMEDQELMLRTYRTSRFASLEEILVGYREDSFSLKKSLSSRVHFAKLLIGLPMQGRNNRFLALRGIVEHGLKAMIEIFAVSTGMPDQILRHRALPVNRGEEARWEKVWRSLVNSEPGGIAPELDVEVQVP